MNFYEIFKAQKLFLKIRFQNISILGNFSIKLRLSILWYLGHNFLLRMNFNVIPVAFETRLNYLYVDR